MYKTKKTSKAEIKRFYLPFVIWIIRCVVGFFLLSLAFTHKKSELTFSRRLFYLFAMLLFSEFAESTFLLLLFCLISFYQKTTSIRLLRNVQCIGLSIHAERTLIIGKQLQPYQNIVIYFNTHCELLSLQQYFGNDDNTTKEKTAQHSKIKNRQIRNVGTHFFIIRRSCYRIFFRSLHCVNSRFHCSKESAEKKRCERMKKGSHTAFNTPRISNGNGLA